MEDTDIMKWLIGDDDREENETGMMMNLSIPTTIKTIKMKQLDVYFSGILVNREYDDNNPEGWKVALPDAQKKKRLTKKQLAKTNKKMTMFLKAPLPEIEAIQLLELENTMLLDDATLERKRIVATKDGDWGTTEGHL